MLWRSPWWVAFFHARHHREDVLGGRERPSSTAMDAEGRSWCSEAPVLTVNDDVAVVERRLAAGDLSCPCGRGKLVGWGWARPRVVRGRVAGRLVRPRRARCSRCAATHVLLPVWMLLRRADSADVVGEAITLNAAGCGARPIAAGLSRPLSTVRGWLRRFAGKAEMLRARFVRLLVAVAADPVVPQSAGSKVADAVAAIVAFADAVAQRFMLMVTPWQIASAASRGGLLSPLPPTESINTSSPCR